MPQQTLTNQIAAVRAALAKPIDFEDFLVKLGPKGRIHAERHVAVCEAEPDPRHGAVWRRLATMLMTLAPHATKINGQQSVQYFVPDGKYKMQVFALEDLRDGNISIYCGNALEDAVKGGVLTPRKKTADTPNVYQVKGTQEWVSVEELDGKSPNPAPFYKDMLGWNRKALRVIVPANATDEQLGAVEGIAAISARKWFLPAQQPA